jgi:aminopeptidase N
VVHAPDNRNQDAYSMRTETGQVFRLEEYRPTDFIIDRVAMTFRLDPTATRVISELTMRRREGTAGNQPLTLDGDELKLVSLAIDGAAAESQRFEARPDRLTVHDLPDGTFTLTIETEIDPSANTQLMGLYR